MKKYFWAVILFFCLLYLVPLFITPVPPNEYKYAIDALNLYRHGQYSLKMLDTLLDGFYINLLGCNQIGLRTSNILAVGLTCLLVFFAIKKCINDNVIALITGLFFFTTSWNLFLALNLNNGIWAGLFNLLALGGFFMAVRENRFSLQRINLLIGCGVLTFISIIMNGFEPFFMSLLICAAFLLAERKYTDMILMPLVVAATTLLLLFIHGYYVERNIFHDIAMTLQEVNFEDLIDFCTHDIFSRLGANIKFMLIGLVPTCVFLLPAYRGFKGYGHNFFKQDIYKFSLVFLIISIIFCIFDRSIQISSLSITYLPFSFLAAAGLVNYLRTRNKYPLLNCSMIIFGIICIIFGSWLIGRGIYFKQPDNYYVGVSSIAWGIFIFSSKKMHIGLRICIYFLGFSIALFGSILYVNDSVKFEHELENSISIATENPDTVKIYASPKMFYSCRFYLGEKTVLYLPENSAFKVANAPDLSIENAPNANQKSTVDKLIFSKDDELPQVATGKTIKFKNFNLHFIPKVD